MVFKHDIHARYSSTIFKHDNYNLFKVINCIIFKYYNFYLFKIIDSILFQYSQVFCSSIRILISSSILLEYQNSDLFKYSPRVSEFWSLQLLSLSILLLKYSLQVFYLSILFKYSLQVSEFQSLQVSEFQSLQVFSSSILKFP